MVAVWAFEGPLSVLRAMGLNPRLHHHRPALWARWLFSRDRSRGREPETEHVALISRAGRYYLGLLPQSDRRCGAGVIEAALATGGKTSKINGHSSRHRSCPFDGPLEPAD